MATRRSDRRHGALGKLSPPRVGRVFGRERLFAVLDAQRERPGLWVSGPPGAGKTTLIASYLDARGLRPLWLQLDAADADPATFAHFLDAALSATTPRRRAAIGVPAADDLRDIPGWMRRCFRRLARALPSPWVLVLDNMQELGEACPLHAGLAAVLAELPPQAQWIAISRMPPGAAFARALAGQQIAHIDARALRFNVEETQALVALHGRAMPAQALHDATDGWAAAMVLMLAGGGHAPQAAVHRGAARDHLFAFFAGEVMEQLAPAHADALMRIAFLPSATAAMAAAISGETRAGGVLADLARRSLFTDRREEAEPVYSFHALFGEFLRARAASRLDGNALRALRLQAADLLAAGGRVDAALAQLIEVRAWDEATKLLAAHASSFVAQGRTASVRDWILALPDTHRTQPAMRYWLGHCELATDAPAALHHLEEAHAGFTAAGDTLGAVCSAAAAADAVVFAGTRMDTLDPWIAVLASHASTCLGLPDVETELRVWPGALAAFVHRATDHPLTATLAERAEGLLDQPLGASQRILLGSLAYYLLWTGQLERLDRIVVKIDRMCATQDEASATLVRWYGVGVLIHSLLGRVDEALADAGRALQLAAGRAPLQARAHLMMVLAALAARDAESARLHLAEAARHLDAANPIDATTYAHHRGIVALLDGDWPAAARLMRAAVASARRSGWPLREHIALLGQALACTECGDIDAAEAALREAFEHRFYAVCRWHHWIAGIIEANLADRRHELPRCVAALQRAFAVGRAHGFDSGPMLYCCGDMMSRLAAIALDRGVDPAFARAMVRRHRLPAPPGAGESWPWPIRIRTLGHFELERDGQPLPVGRKESRKPLDLLKLAIALGGAGVAIDRLVASLWPDAAGDAARNSFDNTLHRLRKLLGDDGHVLLRGGALSLNPATCRVDVLALEAALGSADDKHSDIDAMALAALADDALALYRGPFLAGDDEHAAVLSARSRIQSRFVRRMALLGDRLEAAGEFEAAVSVYRRAVEQEPLAEELYRRLMRCLLQLGQRAEAYEAYRRCRSQLSILLGIRPAAATEALAERLRDGMANL